MDSKLQTLKRFGWTCEHPTRTSPSYGTDSKVYQCLWCEGLLFGVPRSIFLATDADLVMLIGEMRDVTFAEFVTMLETGRDCAVPTVPEKVAVVPDRQRSLFD